jgi:hypothetical protein
MADLPANGPDVHWQTTVSERGGIICVSVPQPSREAAVAAAERMERCREQDGRPLAPGAEVLVELWDDGAGRAIERTLLKTTPAGTVELRQLSLEPEAPSKPAAPQARKLPKPGKKSARPRGRRKR